HAAIMMAVAGVGCAVLPRHCVAQQVAHGQLYERQDPAGPMVHTIYIARVTGYQPPRRVQCVLDWFWQMSAEAKRVKTSALALPPSSKLFGAKDFGHETKAIPMLSSSGNVSALKSGNGVE